MRGSYIFACAGAALIGLAATPSPSFANYVLTKIADTGAGSEFTSVASAVLNNSGHIAFNAVKTGVAGGSYIRHNRVTGVNEFVWNQPSVLTPQMADNGELAWQFNFGSNHTYIRKGSPGNVTLIEEVFTGGHADFPVINAAGDVVYTKASNSVVGRYSINMKEQGGSTLTVTDTGTGPGADDGSFFSFKPDVNDQDQVAYFGNRDAVAGGGEALWLWNKTGNTTTELASSTTGFNFTFGPSINESGQVAFTSNDNSVWVVTAGNAPQLYTTAALAGGSNTAFLTINDAGLVAFGVNGLPGLGSGIFITDGTPGALPTRVVGTGDAFDGSTIRFLNFQRGGFNNAGEIVFAATLTDNRQVIGLAVVPEPHSLMACALGAGSHTAAPPAQCDPDTLKLRVVKMTQPEVGQAVARLNTFPASQFVIALAGPCGRR